MITSLVSVWQIDFNAFDDSREVLLCLLWKARQ